MTTASIHSCLHVRPSPTWVLLAIWGLLYISMTTTAAVPVQRAVSSHEEEVTALKHLMYGMEMVVTIGPKFARVEIEPQFTLAEVITCFAYDFYTHVSTMEAELCTCDPNYNKVAAIKYTTEKVVKNACYWMMHNGNSSNPTISTCSIKDVMDLCLHHKLQQTAANIHLLDIPAGTLGDPRSFLSEGKLPEWLAVTTQPQYGEPPQSVFEALLQMSNCMYGPDGFCSLPPSTVFCTN